MTTHPSHNREMRHPKGGLSRKLRCFPPLRGDYLGNCGAFTPPGGLSPNNPFKP
jgi:hypothetical protein